MTKVANLRFIPLDLVQDESLFVYIGRGAGRCHMLNSRIGEKGWLGNPHSIHSREINIALFKNDFLKRIESDEKFKESVLALKGKTLCCFCKPQACHGDVIAEWIDSYEKDIRKKC